MSTESGCRVLAFKTMHVLGMKIIKIQMEQSALVSFLLLRNSFNPLIPIKGSVLTSRIAWRAGGVGCGKGKVLLFLQGIHGGLHHFFVLTFSFFLSISLALVTECFTA